VEKCLSPSEAFVVTEAGQGSGVLLDDGFVLTNAHVVDPFTAVTVVFPDGDIQDVSVKGVDLRADMALVGPIKGDHPGVALSDAGQLDKGDPLFLVGYPGGATVDEDPEVTIASGVLSRRRRDDRFDLDFIQTDATIAGGQSGGALSDETGRVVGISGYDLDGFALALDGPAAQRAADRIVDGKGDPIGELDDMKASAGGSFTVADPLHPQILVVPAGDERTLHLELGAADQVMVSVFDLAADPFFVEDRLDAFFKGSPLFGDFGIDPSVIGARTAPGVYDVKLDAGFSATVSVFSNSAVPTPVTFTSSEPMKVAEDTDGGATISVGDRRDGVLGFFEVSDDYVIDLAAGQSVDIFAGSAIGDVAFLVRAADGTGEPFQVDDSDEGLFGQNAHDVFTAGAAGRYVITVSPAEPFSIAYRLEIEASGDGADSDTSEAPPNGDSTSDEAPAEPGQTA
jgi:hypothetical protein